jgi:hypothetical protein
LEFALAEDNVAAMVFDRFVDLAFDRADPLFDDTIVYVPGNHDHHLWETARERQYSAYVTSVPPGQPLDPPWHVTRMFEEAAGNVLEAELLNALVRRRVGEHLKVKIVYPNFGLTSRDGSKTVIFHHGHFVESLYRLMSLLRGGIFPRQQARSEIWDWEADNFAWIDFFWSTLGRSGSAGQDVGLVYDMLQSGPAINRVARNLGRLADRGAPRWRGFAADAIVRLTAHFVADRVKRRERFEPTTTLSQRGQAGLQSYLVGPLLRQLQTEHPGASDGAVTFVFGHTHKPFESVEHI